jgi:hypothetical protein
MKQWNAEDVYSATGLENSSLFQAFFMSVLGSALGIIRLLRVFERV